MYGDFPFIAKVNKVNDYPEFKKIEWLFFLKNKYYMSIKLELFKVTEDNSIYLPGLLLERIVDFFDYNQSYRENEVTLKDEMQPDSAFAILKELHQNKKFNIPTVITIKI